MNDEKVEVTVAVAASYLARFDQVAERCGEAGLHVEKTLRTLGVMVGQIDPRRIDKLRQVEGVAAVEESQSYRLAPPDSDVQ